MTVSILNYRFLASLEVKLYFLGSNIVDPGIKCKHFIKYTVTATWQKTANTGCESVWLLRQWWKNILGNFFWTHLEDVPCGNKFSFIHNEQLKLKMWFCLTWFLIFILAVYLSETQLHFILNIYTPHTEQMSSCSPSESEWVIQTGTQHICIFPHYSSYV